MKIQTRTASSYLKQPYTRLLMPDEDGGYYAEILEFPGCRAQGETPGEAYGNLERAAESWIEASLEQEQTIPEPFNNLGFSGRIALRLPRSLHRQAVMMAERDGISLNQFLMSAVASRVGAEEFFVDNHSGTARVDDAGVDQLAQQVQPHLCFLRPCLRVPELRSLL